jgi:tetratricopeptide (TPR) repeat protein
MGVLGGGCAGPAKPADADSTPSPHHDEVAMLLRMGVAQYRAERFDRAIELFTRARRQARAHDDGRAIAMTAYHLALALAAEERTTDARTAMAEVWYHRADHPATLHADARLLAARLALTAGHPSEAREHLDALAAQTLSPARAFAAAILDAHHRLAIGQSLSTQNVTPTTDAEHAAWCQVMGMAAAMDRQHADAGDWFMREASHCRVLGRGRAGARALLRAGQQYEAGHRLRDACDAYYRAARAMEAQGRTEEATVALEAARRLLPHADAALAELIQAQE